MNLYYVGQIQRLIYFLKRKGTVGSEMAVLLKYTLLNTLTHGHVAYSVSYVFKHIVPEEVQADEDFMQPDIYYAEPKLKPKAAID